MRSFSSFDFYSGFPSSPSLISNSGITQRIALLEIIVKIFPFIFSNFLGNTK